MIKFAKAKNLLYEVSASEIQKGDIIRMKGHVQIFVKGDVNGKHWVWESGGGCCDAHHNCWVCLSKPRPRPGRTYYRRFNDCSTSP